MIIDNETHSCYPVDMHPELRRKGDKREESSPIGWVSREDLTHCCPNLEARIMALCNLDIAKIARKVGDALQESYWTALETVLTDYLDRKFHKQDVP